MSPGSESVVGAAFLQKATVQHIVGIKNEGLKENNFINTDIGISLNDDVSAACVCVAFRNKDILRILFYNLLYKNKIHIDFTKSINHMLCSFSKLLENCGKNVLGTRECFYF